MDLTLFDWFQKRHDAWILHFLIGFSDAPTCRLLGASKNLEFSVLLGKGIMDVSLTCKFGLGPAVRVGLVD